MDDASAGCRMRGQVITTRCEAISGWACFDRGLRTELVPIISKTMITTIVRPIAAMIVIVGIATIPACRIEGSKHGT